MASTCYLILAFCLLQIPHHWPILFVNYEGLFYLEVLSQSDLNYLKYFSLHI